MRRPRTWLLVVLALLLRVATLGWDSGILSPHPDERQVAFVSQDAGGWFSDPGFYAYGSLHFHAIRAVSSVLGLGTRYGGLLRGGRILSVAAVLAALLLGWWLARRAWGERTARLAVLLGAFVPLDLQQAHYATVEAHHAGWVMASLAGCWWLAVAGGWPAALAAGGALGLSLAVKVSSLGLAAPLAVAILLAARRTGWVRGLGLAGTAALGALGAFWVGQPWAFAGGRPPLLPLAGLGLAVAAGAVAARREGPARLAAAAAGILAGAAGLWLLRPLFNPAWLEGVGQQVAMVAGRADLPYVRVYRHTLPVLYPLRELALWGLGPALLAAALGGAGAALWISGRRWRRWLAGRVSPGMALLAVLLAWSVPMSLRLATLQVKYLRYWEPLVVPLVLLAAWGLTRLPAGRRVRAGVVGLTVLWGLAWLSAFTDPHPHLTASRWLEEVVRPGQTVAWEHWDEHVRLEVVHDQVELPSYELPDDRSKVEEWCRRLERADWVVLTSNRVRRSVLANPGRYPRTGRLYRLLLAGEAGFEPLTRIHREPHLLGFRAPVQMADESFLNYDFPQVVILRRVAPVTAGELARRVERPLPFLEDLGPGGVERRLVEPVPSLQARPGAVRQAADLVTWVLTLLAGGIAAWILLLPLLRSWPDGGFGLALVTSWIVPPWILWMGSEAGLLRVSPATVTGLWLTLVGAGAWRLASNPRRVAALWSRCRRGVFAVLATAAAVGLLFLVVRAFNPAIFWGEKPMDFSFLNAFLKAPEWPPGEPWMAGLPLHYYYFGEVLAAFPILLAGCTAAVGYNLMAATVPALGAAVLASFGLAVARRRRAAAAWLLPLLVLLTGNLAWPWLLPLAREGRWFDLWWATSRVVPGFAIDEYPLWTALFADLHAHFIALPVMLAALAWGFVTARLGRPRRWVPAAVLTGVSVAVLAATNPWDILILTAALGAGALTARGRALRGLLRLAVAAAVSVAAAAPFLVELAAWLGAGVGGGGVSLNRQDFAPWWAVVRHFGVFLVPLAAAGMLAAGPWAPAAVLLAVLGVVAGVSFHSSGAALALATAGALAVAAARSREGLLRLAWTLAALAMLAVAGAERITLIDRMNTLFKTYNGAWVLLAVALGLVLLRGAPPLRRVALVVWLPLELLALVNLPLGIHQGWAQPKAVSPRPTLDGQAFLPANDPGTWFAVRVLDAAARPGQVVAEASGPAYREFARIVMHTGLPTVVGWEWHLQQRGQDGREIAARNRDLEILYAGGDPAERREVLDRYRVAWIVLGRVERERYGVRADDPFRGVPGVVEIASGRGTAVYRVLPAAPSGGPAQEAGPVPRGTRYLALLPEEAAPRVRSLALSAGGGVAVLSAGSVIRLDREGLPVRAAPAPPCTPVGAVLWSGRLWSACGDGRVLVYGAGWEESSRPGELRGIGAGDDLWAWGPEGLWRSRDGIRWERVVRGPVEAAAADGGRVAWASRGSVWRAWKDRRERLPDPAGGVRALAWDGADLWALTGTGLLRSAGGVVGWLPALPGARVAALAGRERRLWLVLEDGRLVEFLQPPCGSPWEGGRSDLPGRLAEPRGLAVSPRGWFVVADTMNARIQFFTPGGTCLGTFGEEGTAPGQFREPSGVALGPDGTVAVADTWNGRIQLLEPGGTVRVVEGDLFGPRNLMFGPDGTLWVADTGNRRVFSARPPGWRLHEVVRLPGSVVGLAWTGDLLAVGVPSAGRVALVDPAAGRVVRWLDVPGWAGGTQQEGHLLAPAPAVLLASAPAAGEIWELDPGGGRPARRVVEGRPGLTAMARLPDGGLLVALTWDHRLDRLRIP